MGVHLPPSSRSGLFQDHARDKKRTQNPVIVSKDNPVEFDTRKGRPRHPAFPVHQWRKRGKTDGANTCERGLKLYCSTRPSLLPVLWGLARKSVVGENLALWGLAKKENAGGETSAWVGERRFDRKKESNFSLPRLTSSGPFLPPREESRFQAVPPSLVGKPTPLEPSSGCGARQRRHKRNNEGRHLLTNASSIPPFSRERNWKGGSDSTVRRPVNSCYLDLPCATAQNTANGCGINAGKSDLPFLVKRT